MLRPLRLKVKDITGGITGLAISPALNEVKNKIPNITDLVTKKNTQIMIHKHRPMRLNISPRLIIISLQVKYVMSI